MLTIRARQMGWDIFTPGDSTDIDKTLADAEIRLGLEF
jgi:hypothetical protein